LQGASGSAERSYENILSYRSGCFRSPIALLADLRLPPKPTMMEKLGRGVANVTLSVSELFDSPYIATQEGGGTYGDTFGFTQGLSRW